MDDENENHAEDVLIYEDEDEKYKKTGELWANNSESVSPVIPNLLCKENRISLDFPQVWLSFLRLP